MIEAILYGALGFFFAGLIAVLFVPALWNRAARITRRQLEDTLPMTAAEIQADRDRLRAEFATDLRKLETELEKAKNKAVRELVETSKRRVEINELEARLSELQEKLDETESAKRALEQTLNRGLPQMEEELQAAREAMVAIEKTDDELRYRYSRDREALKLLRETEKRQGAEIQRLRATIDADAIPVKRFFSRSDSALAKENRQLISHISALEEELAIARHRDAEDYLLREEMHKLSTQILRAAQGEDAPLPQLIEEEPPADIESYRMANEAFDTPPQEQNAEPAASEPIPEPANPTPSEEKPTAQARPAAGGLKDRLKQKIASEPARTGADAANAKAASLSERFAARRSKAAKGSAAKGNGTKSAPSDAPAAEAVAGESR